MNEPLQEKIQEAIANPRNVGELADADAIGTVGSPDCGDMLRMWIKFKDQDGKRVIDRATFQSFGCETAIAVASVATELIAGKTAEEALNLSGADLSAPLGPLPPMKIHCAQLVEGALRSALAPGSVETARPIPAAQGTINLADSAESGKMTALSPGGGHSPSLFENMGLGVEKQVKVVIHKKD